MVNVDRDLQPPVSTLNADVDPDGTSAARHPHPYLSIFIVEKDEYSSAI